LVDETVKVRVVSSAMFVNHTNVYISSGGYYRIADLNTTHIWFTNLGYDTNATSNVLVIAPAMIVPAGIRGPNGVTGATGAIGATGATGRFTIPIAQPYAPLTPASGCVINAYGDSITNANSLPTPATQSWPALVATSLGCTLNNQGLNGAQWGDNTVYNSYINGMVFLSYGANDIQYQSTYEHVSQGADALALYCSLKNTGRLINARGGAGVVTNGTWRNGVYTNIGIQQITADAGAGSYVMATVIGRYIAAGLTIVTASTFATGVTMDIEIDGVKVSTTPMSLTNNMINTGLGAVYHQSLIFYDTFSAIGATHTIKISFASIPSVRSGNVDWFAGFDKDMSGTEMVILNSLPEYDMFQYYLRSSTTKLPTVGDRDAMNRAYQKIAQKWQLLGLPIYYNDRYGKYATYGLYQGDCLHPNINGNRFIANEILTMMEKGEWDFMAPLKGDSGANAYTTTITSFIQPASGDDVVVNIAATDPFTAGMYIFIATGGQYIITSVNAVTSSITVKNTGIAGNANSGLISSGVLVAPFGAPGPTGAQGVTGAIGATGATGAQGLPGVTGVTGAKGDIGATGATGAQGLRGNTGANGATGPQGAQGVQGAQGLQGVTGDAGLSAYTTTTLTFLQPQADTSPGVFISVVSNAMFSTGSYIYIPLGGYYQVIFKPDSTSMNINNVGYAGNAEAGRSISASSLVTPAGLIGPTGAQGLVGITGPKGSTGSQGAQGVQGATGVTGAIGATGPKGDVGAVGATGPAAQPLATSDSPQFANLAVISSGTSPTITVKSMTANAVAKLALVTAGGTASLTRKDGEGTTLSDPGATNNFLRLASNSVVTNKVALDDGNGMISFPTNTGGITLNSGTLFTVNAGSTMKLTQLPVTTGALLGTDGTSIVSSVSVTGTNGITASYTPSSKTLSVGISTTDPITATVGSLTFPVLPDIPNAGSFGRVLSSYEQQLYTTDLSGGVTGTVTVQITVLGANVWTTLTQFTATCTSSTALFIKLNKKYVPALIQTQIIPVQHGNSVVVGTATTKPYVSEASPGGFYLYTDLGTGSFTSGQTCGIQKHVTISWRF
jgi:hypothetical protein